MPNKGGWFSNWKNDAYDCNEGGQYVQAYNADQYGANPFGHKKMSARHNGPLGEDTPDMIWDEERGGYWIRETVTDSNTQQNAMQGCGGTQGVCGKITRTTEWCEHDDPVIIQVIKKKSKPKVEETIILPPPIYVVPPPQYFVQCPAPEPPKGKSTFFPLVRNERFQLETQEKSRCVSGGACSGCGVGGRAACPRCQSYH